MQRRQLLGFVKEGGLMSFAGACLYLSTQATTEKTRMLYLGAAVFFVTVKYGDKWLRRKGEQAWP